MSRIRGITLKFIPEGDVYRLIVHSKLPDAEKFERWVFDEVLPDIRKHGAYLSDEIIERTLNDMDYLISLANIVKEERAKRKQVEARCSQLTVDNQIMKPKADYFDELVDRNLLTGIRETAKVIGITLPFFSYGGSSLLATFAAMGMVSGVHYRPKKRRSSIYY